MDNHKVSLTNYKYVMFRGIEIYKNRFKYIIE